MCYSSAFWCYFGVILMLFSCYLGVILVLFLGIGVLFLPKKISQQKILSGKKYPKKNFLKQFPKKNFPPKKFKILKNLKKKVDPKGPTVCSRRLQFSAGAIFLVDMKAQNKQIMKIVLRLVALEKLVKSITELITLVDEKKSTFDEKLLVHIMDDVQNTFENEANAKEFEIQLILKRKQLENWNNRLKERKN